MIQVMGSFQVFRFFRVKFQCFAISRGDQSSLRSAWSSLVIQTKITGTLP